MAEGKTSVLASLTAQVMTTSDEKKKAARKLTPVEGETAIEPAPARWPTDLPQAFMSHEGMRDAAKDLRRHAATLTQIADALDAYSGFPTAESGVIESIDEARARREKQADVEHAAKQAEREATFAENFAAKQKAAQDAVYGDALDKEIIALGGVEDPEKPVEYEWRCPIHDKPGIEKKSPSSGRTYIGCPDCKAFQR